MSALALEINSSSLAVAEVRVRKQRTEIGRTALAGLPAGLVSGGEIDDMESVASALRDFWRDTGLRGRRVRLGVANRRVVVRMIDMPAFDDPARLRAAVEQAVTEHLPIAAEDAVVDSQPVSRYWSGSESRERRMVVAANRGMIDGLVATVRAAGLLPVGIDLEAFALLRALLPAPSLVDEGSADASAQVVCHIGADVSQVVVAVDRQCHFTRALDTGATPMIRAVAASTALDTGEAERAMGLCGFDGDDPDGWDTSAVCRVRAALADAVSPLADQVARSLEYYRHQPDAREISGVVITGPGALLSGFDRHLGGRLGLDVRLGDPREQLDDPGGLDLATATRAAVALGLALDAPEDR